MASPFYQWVTSEIEGDSVLAICLNNHLLLCQCEGNIRSATCMNWLSSVPFPNVLLLLTVFLLQFSEISDWGAVWLICVVGLAMHTRACFMDANNHFFLLFHLCKLLKIKIYIMLNFYVFLETRQHLFFILLILILFLWFYIVVLNFPHSIDCKLVML